MRRALLVSAAVGTVAAITAPAGAQVSQLVGGTVPQAPIVASVALSSAGGFTSCGFGELGVGANTKSCAGTFSVASNVAYHVTVQGDQPRMTLVQDGAYVTATKLTNALAVTASPSGHLTGQSTGQRTVSTTATRIAYAPDPLLGATYSHAWTVALAQTVLEADTPGDYQIGLTYTVNAGQGV